MVLFRCEVSDQIGWGHLKRCLSLAQYLNEYVSTTFVVSHPDTRVLESIAQAGSHSHLIPSGLTYKDEVTYYPDFGKNIIVDLGHRISLSQPDEFVAYLTELNSLGYQVAVIDGLGDESFRDKAAPRIKAYIQPYWGVDEESRPNSECWFHGPKYVLVDEIYQNGFKRRNNSGLKNILITFGGSDPQENTLKVLNGILDVCKDLKIRVVIGPSFSAEHIERIEQLSSNYPLELVVAPDNLLRHYHWADLGICGSGSSRYEAAATGLPIIFTSIYLEHDGLSAKFASFGTAYYLGSSSNLSSRDWADSIMKIKSSSELCESMAFSAERMRQSSAGGKILAAELLEMFEK